MAKEIFTDYFADLHIHVGLTENGCWVKIPSSSRLSVREILTQAAGKKGIDIIGIVDALSPAVLADLDKMVSEGVLVPDAKGGYHYLNKVMLILGAEIETTEENGGLAHTLAYLPDIGGMKAFSSHMSKHIKNINLSSQNAHMPLKKLIDMASGFGAVIIPAHIFTPHKSVYGSCARRLSELLSPKELNSITAVELGLSADSFMADRLEELASYSFVSNSDAHSLEKIGREYNIFSLAGKTANFEEIILALTQQKGRMVKANYGLNPRLGKYHRTMCASCGSLIKENTGQIEFCPKCQSCRIIKGVFDRVEEIADWPVARPPAGRPGYFYQIPLEFIPGLGAKTMYKLIEKFNTEMNILNFADYSELVLVAGTKVARNIIEAREGRASISDGGGGVYGKVN